MAKAIGIAEGKIEQVRGSAAERLNEVGSIGAVLR